MKLPDKMINENGNIRVRTEYGSYVNPDEYGLAQQKNAMTYKEALRYGYKGIRMDRHFVKASFYVSEDAYVCEVEDDAHRQELENDHREVEDFLVEIPQEVIDEIRAPLEKALANVQKKLGVTTYGS